MKKQKIGILHVNYLFNKTFLIDSTNMLYIEGFYKFCLCSNLEIIYVILNFPQTTKQENL